MLKKRLTGIVLALCLLMNGAVPVLAKLSSDDLAVVAGYAMDGELYMFASLDDKYKGAELDAKVTVDGITIANRTSPKEIGESDATIKYLLMIDQSGSMNQYVDRVNAFVDALADREQANAVFTIAGFGGDFDVISENITDKEAVKSAIAGLSYQEPWTDPYNAIVKALNYVDTTSRTGGEVLNIIVVSDGDADLGIDDAEEAEQAEQERAAAAKKKIQKSPEVLIHTFGVTEWEALCMDTYEAGRGDNAVIHDAGEASAYGEKIADYIDNLYFLEFTLKKDVGTKRFAVDVQMTGADSAGTPAIMDTTLEKIPNLTNYVVEESEEDIFQIIDNAGEEQDGSGELETDRKPEDVPEGQGQPEDSSGIVQESDPAEGQDAEETHQPLNRMLAVCAAVIAVCLLVIGLLVYLMTRKKRRETGTESFQGTGLPVWLDAVSGEIKRPKGRFCLSGAMVIGSSSKADIVLKADGVCSEHARLYVSDGRVYIQDISGSAGVFISGMRLQAPNRLADGDEITIGSAKIVIRM